MKRRAILASLGATTSAALVGCADTVQRTDEDGRSLQDVEHVPDGVTAVYDYLEYDDDDDAPNTDAGKAIIIDDMDVVDDQLGGHEDVAAFVEPVDFDDAYVVASREVFPGTVRDVTVDAIRQRNNGLRFDIHYDLAHDWNEFTEIIGLVEVRGADDPPESVVDEWMNPVVCDTDYAPYYRLPDPVRWEVDLALEEGAYETDKTLLYPKAVPEDATLWKNDEYYETTVERDGDASTLEFEEVEDGHSSPARLHVINGRDDPFEVSVVVADEETTILDEEFVLEPPEDEEVNGPVDYVDSEKFESFDLVETFGEYDLSLEKDDGETLEESISVDPEQEEWYLSFREEDDHADEVELNSDNDLDNMSYSKPVGICIAGTGGWWGYPEG